MTYLLIKYLIIKARIRRIIFKPKYFFIEMVTTDVKYTGDWQETIELYEKIKLERKATWYRRFRIDLTDTTIVNERLIILPKVQKNTEIIIKKTSAMGHTKIEINSEEFDIG